MALRVVVGESVRVAVPQEVEEAEAQAEALGLPVPLRVALLQPLPVRVTVPVLDTLALGVLELKALVVMVVVGEVLPQCETVGEAEVVRVPVALRHCVGVPLPV